jgi:hypothetical protein
MAQSFYASSMVNRVRVAYLVVLAALVVTGFLIDVSWWQGALIGSAAMLPILVADIVTTRRRATAQRGT